MGSEPDHTFLSDNERRVLGNLITIRKKDETNTFHQASLVGKDPQAAHNDDLLVANNAIDKLPLYRGHVFQGTNLPEYVEPLIKAGALLTCPSFDVCSSHYRQLRQHGWDFLFKIRCRTGVMLPQSLKSQALDTSTCDDSVADGEKLVLFRPGTTFYIQSVEQVGFWTQLVTMKEASQDQMLAQSERTTGGDDKRHHAVKFPTMPGKHGPVPAMRNKDQCPTTPFSRPMLLDSIGRG